MAAASGECCAPVSGGNGNVEFLPTLDPLASTVQTTDDALLRLLILLSGSEPSRVSGCESELEYPDAGSVPAIY